VHDDLLAAIFVTPLSQVSTQGEGTGSALVQRAKRRRGSLTLSVYTQNGAAVVYVDSYRHHGVSVIGEDIDEHTGHVEPRMLWSH